MSNKKSKRAGVIDVLLEIVPLQGKKESKSIRVKVQALMSQVLEVAGIDPKRKNLTINGKPATLDTPVGNGEKVQVTERPQGS